MGGQLRPGPVCRDSHSSAPAHSTFEPRVPGPSHFSGEARNRHVCHFQCWQLIFTLGKNTTWAKHNAPEGWPGTRATSLSPWWLALVAHQAFNRPVTPKPGTRGWDGEGSTSLTPCGSSDYPSLWEGRAGLVGAGAVGIACRALPST